MSPNAHRFNAAIFREYDIRGIAGIDLREQDVYLIARAFAAKALSAAPEGATVCIGRDGRHSSPALLEALCRGLTDSGVNVIDIGLGPTPMLYFASHTLSATGGIMITGSHNPPDHNGLKFVFKNKAFYGADIKALHTAALADDFASGHGVRKQHDISEAYTAALAQAYGARPLKAAWDAGNGAAGDIMAALCARLPGKHVLLNEHIDGSFPAHHPDPTEPKNLVQLIDTVKAQSLDIGIAFDGDGDRIGVVDDEGEIIWGDQLLLLLAKDVLAQNPGATIIADVKASGVLFEGIEVLGGTPLMWKTGHSHIKSKMFETGAPLAGEMSGHIFFADKYYGFDDALYAAVRTLAMLSRSGEKLSSLRKAIPRRVSTPEIRFHCDDARKFAVIEEVRARLTAAGAEFSSVDGMRVMTSSGWWLLRASNTQPMLVARCEAMENQGLELLKQDLRYQLSLSNVALP